MRLTNNNLESVEVTVEEQQTKKTSYYGKSLKEQFEELKKRLKERLS